MKKVEITLFDITEKRMNTESHFANGSDKDMDILYGLIIDMFEDTDKLNKVVKMMNELNNAKG